MIERELLHRMQVAIEANAAAYRRTSQTSAPGDCWDFVILTAANEKQAHGYRQELSLRHRSVGPTGAFFPAIQKSVVVPDPPGRRAGSGGATLGVLQELIRQHSLKPEAFDQLHLLLIHSGGASQRLPAYSPLGKIFAPLPLLRPDGQISTLFDHLYLTLAGLPERLGPGMLIVAGDVFLLFDHRHVSVPAKGVTALTMRVDTELGRGHGVFVTDETGQIRQTLQKASPEAQRAAGAADAQGQILIDTGLLFFDIEQTRRLAALAGCDGFNGGRKSVALHEKFKQQIDLYEDMTAALASGTQEDAFLANPTTTEMRRELWKTLHGVPFQTMKLEGQFLHLGTTRQFRDAMAGGHASPAAELFQQNVLAYGQWPLKPGRRVYHSALLGESGSIGAGSVVEHSILGAGTRIGSGSVVSQVLAVDRPIDLGDDLLLFQVPVRGPGGELVYAQCLCGADDDFKGKHAEGKCFFLNGPIEPWLQRHGITPEDLWPDTPADQRTLWNARIFAGTKDRDAADVTLWFTRQGKATQEVAEWRTSPRYSMAMLLEQADPVALIEHREFVAAYLQTGTLLESVKRGEDQPLDRFIGHYASAGAYEASVARILAFADVPPAAPEHALQQARAFWSAAQILQRPDYPAGPEVRTRIDDLMVRSFAKVREASELAVGEVVVRASACPTRQAEACTTMTLQPGQRIEAASPVRLDLGGGWSDTPPACCERGGHVINIAVDLDGHPPVRAIVRTLREPMLVLESNDLSQHIELKSVEALNKASGVHDPFALHKVALDMAGLLPPAGTDLTKHMKKLGGGLMVSTEARVPKGSGLGTSSILAATLLAALHETVGRPATHDQLIEQALLLEQRLSTGGGWQDQVGGIVGGLKSTTTAPGLPQKPIVEPLALSDEAYHAIEERLVVYYSGQQRLARDILRRVMGRWLAREPAVVMLMEDLKRSAADLRTALLKNRWPAAAREIGRYWEIKKQLYPGSTTPMIDVLFLELREHYLAAGLAGAGGGGFSYFFCKDARQAMRLREQLAAQSARPGSMGSLFQTRINRTGLAITRNAL